jgi:hypothetical protein
MIPLINLLWVIYSCLEGTRDGFYWFFKGNSRKDISYEIHPLFAWQRGVVLFMLVLLQYRYIGWYSILNTFAMAMIFSFFHNGSYYQTRNKIDSKTYPLGWKDQSTTSTAKLTKMMTYRNRSILMAIGVSIQVFIYIFIYIKNK